MQILASFSRFNYWLIRFSVLTIVYVPIVNSKTEIETQFPSDQPLQSPIRQFPRSSRANRVRAILGYDEKPAWPLQWYMNEELFSVANHDYSPSMKIVEFHRLKLKGQNTAVVIIGNTPVNCEHKEIKERCFLNLSSYSYHAKKPIFSFCFPQKICSSNSLATVAAGIIGMTDAGQNGGVGIAPKCKIGNIVIEPSTKSGSPEHGAVKILSSISEPGNYVFVHVWNLSSYDYTSRILHALEDINMLNFDSKRQLRPHAMGSGDLGILASSCQCNEYAAADAMFVFGSVAYNGFLTSYSETCASLIGVTYSTSDGNQFYNNIITITHSTNESPAYAPKRTTAVSAAIGGGIIALINEIFFEKFHRSPSISDLAFLLAFSSTSDGLKDKNMLWFTNGVGKEYSPQAGFGLPRLDKISTFLSSWTPIESPTVYKFSRFDRQVEFKCHKDRRTRSLTYMFNLVCFFQIFNSQARRHIQLITVKLSARLKKRGALSVYLISPAGTVSCILEGRPYDIHKKNYKNLLLRTNHFIGETIQGQWSIRFYMYKEDSRPSYESLREYSFSTRQQQTTLPLKSHNAGHHQPIPPVGTLNSGSLSDSNFIDSVSFRFLLVENLPSILEVQQRKKNVNQIKLDFELIKAWVDFRHFLLVQTDPKNFGTSTVDFREVYDLTKYFVKKLSLIQKKIKIDSSATSSL